VSETGKLKSDESREKKEGTASQESLAADVSPSGDYDSEESESVALTTGTSTAPGIKVSRRAHPNKKSSGTDDVGREIVKYFQSRGVEKDENALFFESLKAMLGRVPEQSKFACKLAIMNIIHCYEQPSHAQAATTPSWPAAAARYTSSVSCGF